MSSSYHPSDEILFGENDQQEWPEEMKDHILKAAAHKAGHGPHPGRYKGPPPVDRQPDTTELARERMMETGPAQELPPPGPLPPQESVDQPPPAGGKKKGGGKPPGGTTPTAIGAAAVKPEEPEGGF
jgi:hypothetical protein